MCFHHTEALLLLDYLSTEGSLPPNGNGSYMHVHTIVLLMEMFFVPYVRTYVHTYTCTGGKE